MMNKIANTFSFPVYVSTDFDLSKNANQQDSAQPSAPPEWIMLWSGGDLVQGKDGRTFKIADVQKVVSATNSRLPLVIDYEHDSELRKVSDYTPAAGWVEELKIENGAILGRVNWSPKAANAILDKEFRFLSPVYLCTPKTKPMQIEAICSVGLTHRPNLDLKALNSTSEGNKERKMQDALLKALGVKEDIKDEGDALVAALNAIEGLKNPSLEKYVPRADYDAALLKAKNAEIKLEQIKIQENEAKVQALVEKAILEGKVAPASKDHFLKIATNSFDEVVAFLSQAPTVISRGEDQALKGGVVQQNSSSLNESEKELCSAMNISEEEYIKVRG